LLKTLYLYTNLEIIMNKIPYQYIQNDLLTTPQKYQISSYEGPGFLTSYQFSRRIHSY